MNFRPVPRLSCIAALVCYLLAGAAYAQQLQDVRLGRYESKSRMVFDFSSPVAYSVQQLDDPARIVISLPEATCDDLPTQLDFVRTPISKLTLENSSPAGVVATVALDQAARAKSFVLEPSGDRGFRVVVDIYHQAASATGKQASLAPTTSSTTSPRQTVADNPSSGSGPNIEFSGTWQQEWAYQTGDTGNQKFEALIQPRLDIGFDSGSQLVVIGRVRLDAVGDLGPDEHRPDNYSEVNGPIYNDKYAELSLRELYYDTRWAGAYWRLGKQQVVWGQADGIKVLDVVNPQSFREFILDDFDDSRIPLWMINAELPLSEGSLQFLWIPDTTYHELAEAGTPYFLTSPKWVPTVTPGVSVDVSSLDKPNNPLEDGDMGLRYSAFLGGWDITLNYLYHYQDFPVLYQQYQQANGVELTQVNPTYKRNQLFGTTLSNAFNAFTLRAELAYSTDTYHTTSPGTGRGIANSDEVASVIGLDWQYNSDSLLSAQWFMSHLPDYRHEIVRGKSENTFSLLLQQGFANDTWQLRVLGLYSLDDEDSLIELKLKYWLLSDLEIWLGADIFDGTQRGSFGQFDEQSRVLMGMEYGF